MNVKPLVLSERSARHTLAMCLRATKHRAAHKQSASHWRGVLLDFDFWQGARENRIRERAAELLQQARKIATARREVRALLGAVYRSGP
jgi:hypothetical protein